jgi:uncharacterized protein YyaL (SSP411 family)
MKLYVASNEWEFGTTKASSAVVRLRGMCRKAMLPVLLAFTSLLALNAARWSPSHLAASGSAYLRRAGEQPVDWYPWGPEAWRQAKELDRPLLLDLGAVWCGWCDLMDRESYKRADLATFINANFVAVKVDYDTQPQLAAELERAQAVLNLPSGLPLTGFLTPGGKLYFGGTHFPHETKRDKPAFEVALKQALRMYRDRRAEVERDGVKLELSKEK